MAGDPKPFREGEPSDVTLLLNRMRNGDSAAGDEAASLVYDELHRIAAREMRHENEGHLLQTTALVHEAYVRLAGSGSLEIQNRGHFFAVASRQMRRILVDYARSSNAQRRGGGAAKVDLDQLQIAVDPRSDDVVSLDEALRELERIYPRAAKVVELRYFGGYTDTEVVEALGVSTATVRRDWEFARSWLFKQMQGKPAL
jgi:RNA polymerase sigma-70 factor, ECF subfamily